MRCVPCPVKAALMFPRLRWRRWRDKKTLLFEKRSKNFFTLARALQQHARQ
jgi:hypothetical protein